MKIIRYKFLASETEGSLIDIAYRCSAENLEANVEIAKREAYNGEYTVEDDGQPEPETDATPALYVAIGLDDSGYPVWSQPTGAHDAYNTGDIVTYNGTLYQSLIDGNVNSPEAYPAGWAVYAE